MPFGESAGGDSDTASTKFLHADHNVGFGSVPSMALAGRPGPMETDLPEGGFDLQAPEHQPTASAPLSDAMPGIPAPPAELPRASADDHLFQSAKALVQHHFVHSPLIATPIALPAQPEPQRYPPARATHAEVYGSAGLFQDTLRELYDALDIRVAKVMKLGGQELNLHLLYQRVTDAGGALQVIRDKHWRDVGDAFHLPKTITSLSFVLKRGYMQYLWDYEQVYFQRRSGHERVAPPASKAKDGSDYHGRHPAAAHPHGHHTHVLHPAGAPTSHGSVVHYHPAYHPAVHPAHAVDAAAAMAVAALRGRTDWTGVQATSQGAQHAQHMEIKPSISQEGGGGAGPFPDRVSAKSQASISREISEGGSSGAAFAAAGMDDAAVPPPASPTKEERALTDAMEDANMLDDPPAPDSGAAAAVPPPQEPPPAGASSGAAALPTLPPTLLHPAPGMYAPLTTYAASAPPPPLPFAAMMTAPPPHSRLEALVGTSGSLCAVSALGGHGLVVSGSVGGVPITGVIGAASGGLPAAVPAAGAEPSVVGGAAAAAKRVRLTAQPRLLPSPRLPDTVESLLARLSVCVDGGPVASAATPQGGLLGSTQGERAAGMWMRLDAHKRDMVQQAVRADEDRYKCEVQARDAAQVRERATLRRDEVLRAAEETMLACKGTLLGHAAAAPPATHAAPLPNPPGSSPQAAFRQCAAPDTTMLPTPNPYGSPAPDSPRRPPSGFDDIYPSPHPTSLGMDTWVPPTSAAPPFTPSPGGLLAGGGPGDDPLMSKRVADTGQSVAAESLLGPARHQPAPAGGGHAFVHSAPGGQNSLKRDVNGNMVRGPVASPNTKATLLPMNRHKVYPMAPDRFVQPVPTEPVPSPTDFPTMDDQMELALNDSFLNDDLVEMLGLADDLMLEEPA
eukprot:jgi/Ulvmu1/10824/UM069_0060.1